MCSPHVWPRILSPTRDRVSVLQCAGGLLFLRFVAASVPPPPLTSAHSAVALGFQLGASSAQVDTAARAMGTGHWALGARARPFGCSAHSRHGVAPLTCLSRLGAASCASCASRSLRSSSRSHSPMAQSFYCGRRGCVLVHSALCTVIFSVPFSDATLVKPLFYEFATPSPTFTSTSRCCLL